MMEELPFEVEIDWAGSGREGVGRIVTDDLEVACSTPASMGGRGIGSNPEELLVSAVATCYAATLIGVLRRAGLPAASVRVGARGTVGGYPEQARFERIVVSPAIRAGDPTRIREYERAARVAHDRCFIGRTIAGNVAYEVGSVSLPQAELAA